MGHVQPGGGTAAAQRRGLREQCFRELQVGPSPGDSLEGALARLLQLRPLALVHREHGLEQQVGGVTALPFCPPSVHLKRFALAPRIVAEHPKLAALDLPIDEVLFLEVVSVADGVVHAEHHTAVI
jgi:hypothetical protein